MSNNNPDFSERARNFLDARGRERKQTVEPDQYGFDPKKYPDIPTSEELKRLQEERPDPAPHLTPDGWNPPELTDAQEQDNAEREERISYLIDRLEQERENLEVRFDQSTEIEP